MWYAGGDWDDLRLFPVQDYFLRSICQEGFDPRQAIATDSIVVEFQGYMRLCGTLSNAFEKLSNMPSATLAKAMLGVVEDGVVVEVAHYAGRYDVLHQFAGDGSQ